MLSSFFKQSRGVGTQNGTSDTSTSDTFDSRLPTLDSDTRSISDSVGISEVPTPVSERPALIQGLYWQQWKNNG